MKFEDYPHHQGEAIVNTVYHWESRDTAIRKKPLTLKLISNKRYFYACDDFYTWASPHLKETQRLFEVEVITKHPLVLLEQYVAFEHNEYTRIYGSLIKQHQYDAVIYTAHQHSTGTRQMVLLYPKDQILAIREVTDIDWDYIERMREKR